MQCVILAGGLGTRMKAHAEKIPKSLISVHNRPFLHYQLERLRAEGVSRVVLCIGHMGEQIRGFAGDGRAWGISIRYIEEGQELRGTGGALRLAFDEGALEERFLVLYGDSFLPISLEPIWKRALDKNYPALMSVLKNDGKWDRSNVRFDGERVILYDKHGQAHEEMRYIDYGLSVLTRAVVEKEIPSGERRDLADVYNVLSRRGELGGYEVHTRFFEIGSPAGLHDFAEYIAGHPNS
jgi:NDP-sugar pyrophosphorylase family protein